MYVISHYVQHRHHMYVHLHGASRSAWHQYLYINIMYTDNLDCNKQNRDKINAVRKKHCSETIVKNKNKTKQKRGKFGQMNTNLFFNEHVAKKEWWHISIVQKEDARMLHIQRRTNNLGRNEFRQMLWSMWVRTEVWNQWSWHMDMSGENEEEHVMCVAQPNNGGKSSAMTWGN